MNRPKSILLCALCAAVGGAIGWAGFVWMVRQGFYSLVLPGGVLGLGAGIFKHQTRWFPMASTAAATVLGLVAEWRSAPFIPNPSFGYFLSHLVALKPVTLVMIAVGSIIAFWVPYRRG